MRAGTFDVAVIGTGVVGLAIADELAARGHRVCLLGRLAPAHVGEYGSASAAAGAMLTVLSEVDSSQDRDTAGVNLAERVAARRVYQDWLDALAEAGGHRVRLREGTWVVGDHDDALELDTIAGAAAAHRLPVEEHPATAVPGLAPARGHRPDRALYLPEDAGLDGAALLAALTAAVAARPGLRHVPEEAVRVERRAGGVRIHLGSGPVEAGTVVLAAGVGTNRVPGARPDDLGLPAIHAKRGVGIVVRTASGPPCPVRTPTRRGRTGAHLVPRNGGHVYVGSTSSPVAATGDPRGATPAEVGQLVRDATTELDTGLRGARVVSAHAGDRPYTLDGLPLLGPAADPGFVVASATNRCGVLLAPRFARLVADEVARPGTLAEHPYSPSSSARSRTRRLDGVAVGDREGHR